jgi:hypothetical protein
LWDGESCPCWRKTTNDITQYAPQKKGKHSKLKPIHAHHSLWVFSPDRMTKEPTDLLAENLVGCTYKYDVKTIFNCLKEGIRTRRMIIIPTGGSKVR